MKLIVEKSTLSGSVPIPPSKSHTIRALILATLARGRSEIVNPLDSADTRSCVNVCRAFGAEVELGDRWLVTGVAGRPKSPPDAVDVGNSGTTLYFGLSAAALGDGRTVLTGDDQTRRRPAQPLLDALCSLGAEAHSEAGNGCAPIAVKGRMRGGHATIRCPTSQYLSSLLLSCPLAERDTEIDVLELNERPYIQMTLDWLNRLDVAYSHERMGQFHIPGGQCYQAYKDRVPGDFSSATFFLCAAAITGSELTLDGLTMNDSQGDKAVVDMLREMGAVVHAKPGVVTIAGGPLRGGRFDLNATPDALPAMAVTACFAEGETHLVNVPQARLKETDRLAVMAETLRAMGGDVEELEDGLVIRGRRLKGATVNGHGDHRVVMALAIGGLAADGRTTISTAESVAVTFPNFVELMQGCGARMQRTE